MNCVKILTLLGFAAKAGRLSFGFDTSLSAIKKQQSQIVVCGQDLSAKSFKEMSFHAQKNGVEIFSLKGITNDSLSHAVGRKCGIISVNDNGFAKSLKEEILNGK